MTTERDIRNYITFAREEGREEGRVEEREKTLQFVTEQLRKRGFSEEDIKSLLTKEES